MKLKKLIVQGFKSFKDKTTINFDAGITGIVGPNGCGKSNIVDALFWVMGEQSAKHLRGSSMKDVIFAGSAKYAPASWAEVDLVLENDKGKHIHIGDKVYCPAEIMLTRKLYRNGETEYRINSTICRLRDIQEVFMDTGVGVKSYSIIAQGEINRLVQAGPLEKRTMIEDVAGTTKFKLRKKESMKKIEQTELNLGRLNDIKVEIKRQLEVLEGQSEKAEKAIVLREKLQRNELTVQSHKEFEILSEFKEKRTSTFDKVQDLESSKLEKDRLDLSIEQDRLMKEEITEKVDLLQLQYNEVAKKLAAGEERYQLLSKARVEKINLGELKNKENSELLLELDERKKRLELLEGELDNLELQSDDLSSFEDLKETVELLKDELEIKESSISELKIEVDSSKEQLRNIEQEHYKSSARSDELQNRLQEILDQIDGLEGELAKRMDQVTHSKVKMLEMDASFKEAELNVNDLESSVKSKSSLLRTLDEDLKNTQRQMFRSESKLASLEEIQNFEKEGKIDNEDFLKTEAGKQYELLGKLFKCDEVYAKSVQNLLDGFLNSIVGQNNHYDHLWAWAQENDEKELSYKTLMFSQENKVKLNKVEIEKTLGGNKLVEEAIEKVQISGNGVGSEKIFQNSFICDNLNTEEIELLSKVEGNWRLATLDGKVLISKFDGICQVKRFADFDGKQGIIFRNNEIVRLKSELNLLQGQTAEKEDLKDKYQKELEDLKTKHSHWQKVYGETKTALALIKAEVDNLSVGLEKDKSKLEELRLKKSSTSKEKLSLIEKEEILNQKIDDLTDLLETRQGVLEELQESYNIKKITYSDEKEKLILKQTEVKTYEQRLNSLKSQIEDIEKQIERYELRHQSNEEQIVALRDEVIRTGEELELLKITNHDDASVLSRQEKGLLEGKRELTKIVDLIEEKDKSIRNFALKINKLEKDILVFKTKMEQFIVDEELCVRNIFEKYRINLRQVIGSHLGLSSDDLKEFADLSSMFYMETETGPQLIETVPYEFNRKYGQELESAKEKFRRYQREIQLLGEINWSAVEEYNRQKKRYDFLIDQEVQLKKSLEDLQNAIRQIDEKSKLRFKEAFDEVNIRFKRVFPILFGGGEASLQLQGQIEDPEAGVEIIAQPPGKKMQNINLMSGGEKAMTAVSLIFSTFLVRPSPFCLLDEVDAPLDDANVTRFNEMLREMSGESQFVLITHNKKTMELNDILYGITMQEPGISKAVSVQLQ